jgi:hypothetical protein
MLTMLTKLKSLWNSEWPFVWTVIKQLFIPAVIAALYGIFDWVSSSKGDFSLAAYLKITLPALFFIMWFVGLYERAKKKNTDKESFENINTGIQSLTEIVKELQTSPHSHSPAPTPIQLGTTFSASLITEAFTIFKTGHKLAALLQAGVAFEHALRSFAVSRGVEDAEQMPLLRILQKIDFLLPQGWEGEFHMLRKIRNQLAHASEQEIEHIEPEFVLNTYAMAIGVLNDNNPA